MPKYNIRCCIPGCKVPGVTQHRFPNPKKKREMYDRWLELINLTFLRDMDPETVYMHKRICYVHFDSTFRSPGNPRLHFGAYPTLNLPGQSVTISDPVSDLPSTSVKVTPEILRSALETKERPSTVAEVFLPVSESPIRSKDGELFRSVTGNRRTELTPKARKMYDIANLFKRRASRTRKKYSSFYQRLAAAEEYAECDTFQKVVNNLTPAAEKFLWMQIRESAKNPKERTFTTDEKTLALSLFKKSPKGYDLLQEMFSLPCRKTLNNISTDDKEKYNS